MRTLGSQILVIVALMALSCIPARAQAVMPNPKLTPGAVFPWATAAVICGPSFRTYKVRHVTEATKERVCRAYQRTDPCPDGRFEIDHLVPLELGGSNAMANLWAQPEPAAHDKDRLGNWLHRQVCAGAITLPDAQHSIATNWYAAYQRMRAAEGGR